MGLIILGLLSTSIVDSVNNIYNDPSELVENNTDIFSTRGTRGEPWRINSTRTFDNEDHTRSQNITIYESGSLTIIESTLSIDQTRDFEYQIVVKDSGKLVLENGTIKSNFAIKVIIQNFGNLNLKDKSYLLVNELEADGNSKLTIDDSEISTADNDLFVHLSGFSNLEMRQRAKIKSKTFSGEGSSSIVLDNSNIIADAFTVNCSKVNIKNNNNVVNFAVDSCLNFSISNSVVEELTVSNCIQVTIEDSTVVRDSKIEIASNVLIENSQVTNLSISYCTSELLLSGAIVEGLDAFDCETVTVIGNSKITDSEITTCKDLVISDIFELDSLQVDNCENSVSIIRSTIKHLSVWAPYMYMKGSNIASTKEELDILTKATTFYASDTNFNHALNFSGNTEAYLININPVGVMPEVYVSGNAEVSIYWWLTINVIDNESNPLEGVEVNLYNFFSEELVNSSVTDVDGMVQFAVLSNVIVSGGPKHPENESYYYEGIYGNFKTVDSRSTRMDHNRNRELIFGESLTAIDDDGDDEATFLEMYLGIIIVLILVIIVLGILASRGGGSKKKSPPEDEGDHRPGPRGGGRRYPPPRGGPYRRTR
jgi:hypothetical protein